MSDWSELKRLAEAAKRLDWSRLVDASRRPGEISNSFMKECSPCTVLALIAENERLRAGARGYFDLDAWLDWSKEAESLRAEAAEDIADWGAYAGEYFQQKHDLAGCVARYREALGKGGRKDG